MKELPKMYKHTIDYEIKNNKDMVYVKSSEEGGKRNQENTILSIEDKLSKIFNTSRHTFNIPVEIVTHSKTYSSKIAGKMKDCIITLDNDVIPIDTIIDIKEKI